MQDLDLKDVERFVNKNISTFHQSKLKTLQALNLTKLLQNKNPYLFKAKNINLAHDLIQLLLDAYLSSSEEKIFGDFLEQLAIFVASKTCNGRKSGIQGIDLEFENEGKLYLVSVKSGPNWGNNAQQGKQAQDFQTAVKVLKQSKHTLSVETVLGICYGKTRTSYVRSALKVVGQNFWHFISGSTQLYIDIIEPLGYKAKQHNKRFLKEKDKLINLFSRDFLQDFCNKEGVIDWKKVVKFNSGNLDLDKKPK